MNIYVRNLILALPLVFLISSCGQQSTNAALQASPTPAKTEAPRSVETYSDDKKASINGREVTLSDKDGKCRLSSGDTVVELDLPTGCDFHRLPNKEVRVFPKDVYTKPNKIPKKYSKLNIIIVEHSMPGNKNPKDCMTQIQAVKIDGAKIEKSTVMSNLASCPPFQWDAMNFTALFEKSGK